MRAESRPCSGAGPDPAAGPKTEVPRDSNHKRDASILRSRAPFVAHAKANFEALKETVSPAVTHALQNDAMISATVESGQRNMAVLEQSVIKDNTLMPGEWYGGQLHLAPPVDQAGAPKSYTIVITVGADRHVIDVSQGPAGA